MFSSEHGGECVLVCEHEKVCPIHKFDFGSVITDNLQILCEDCVKLGEEIEKGREYTKEETFGDTHVKLHLFNRLMNTDGVDLFRRVSNPRIVHVPGFDPTLYA